MTYKVKLDTFEGPLDLLLFLIKKNEVDIYDIPVSKITQQFLEYLDIIKLLDIEFASDFILLASTLLRIKAQMLLPKPSIEEDEEVVEDPRQELVYRLLEYKRFKDVAENLSEKEEFARNLYTRGSFKIESPGFADELVDERADVSLFDLVTAFKTIVEKNKKVVVHRVRMLNVNLEERIEFVISRIKEYGEINFTALFEPTDDKLVWIVTFIAILELVKNQVIMALQSETFGEIILRMLDGIETA
ncbi:MAG TPA: segregation/condensation protein A [bacterium]|nr:segregation/condensation protein A [bacterium]HPN44128.1 segregation/condensation protein A [bacterium]